MEVERFLGLGGYSCNGGLNQEHRPVWNWGLLVLTVLLTSCTPAQEKVAEALPVIEDERMLVYISTPEKDDLQFYWKSKSGRRYANFEALRKAVGERGDSLLFAVNGGMYDKAHLPEGLYVEAGAVLSPMDTVTKGYGNFYLQPNGVFGLLKGGNPIICVTDSFKLRPDLLQYATQSGPMLVVDGKLHPAFNEGSSNVNIRNGVGLLPDGRLLFVMSKVKINFFDFATFFKANGCKQALYLDGFVSRTWLPEKGWRQTDGDFGVIIAVTSHK